MSIAPGKIVTQNRDLYRVDGWLMDPGAIPADTNVPFELEMKCYQPTAWQETVHQNVWGTCSICTREEVQAKLEVALDAFMDCIRGCESQFCNESCVVRWQEDKEQIIEDCTS